VVVNSKNGRYGEPWYVDPFAVGVLGLAWMHGRRGYVSGELPRDRAGGTNREIAYLLATYGVTALDGTLNFRRQPSS